MNEKKFFPDLDTRIFGRVQEELKNRSKRCYGELEDNRKLCLREIEQLEVSESTAQEKEELLRTGAERTGSGGSACLCRAFTGRRESAV